jgi:hypothetical protein
MADPSVRIRIVVPITGTHIDLVRDPIQRAETGRRHDRSHSASTTTALTAPEAVPPPGRCLAYLPCRPHAGERMDATGGGAQNDNSTGWDLRIAVGAVRQRICLTDSHSSGGRAARPVGVGGRRNLGGSLSGSARAPRRRSAAYPALLKHGRCHSRPVQERAHPEGQRAAHWPSFEKQPGAPASKPDGAGTRPAREGVPSPRGRDTLTYPHYSSLLVASLTSAR